MGVEQRWTVYILRCADGSYYTGISLNVAARLEAHNAGRGAKYTRAKRPCVLVYIEPVMGNGAALRRERLIKKMTHSKKRSLVEREGI